MPNPGQGRRPNRPHCLHRVWREGSHPPHRDSGYHRDGHMIVAASTQHEKSLERRPSYPAAEPDPSTVGVRPVHDLHSEDLASRFRVTRPA